MWQIIQQLGEEGFIFNGMTPLTQRGHPLMHRLAPGSAHFFFQLGTRYHLAADAQFTRQRPHLVQTLVGALLLKQQLDDILRITPQQLGHGVNSNNPFSR